MLERAILAVAEKAAASEGIVDEALATGLGGSHPVTVHAKMLRQELQVKASMERELERHVLNCTLRPDRPLGFRARCVTGSLGAQGTSAQRRASRLPLTANGCLEPRRTQGGIRRGSRQGWC